MDIRAEWIARMDESCRATIGIPLEVDPKFSRFERYTFDIDG
jgi:hypothetical protein